MLNKINLDKLLLTLLTISCLLILSIFFIRFENSISFTYLTHVLTSGYEEESLLEIWYKIKGETMYVDHLAYPYRWTIYNWLFYDFYSIIFKVLNEAYGFEFDWLPTVLRLLTLTSSCLLLFIIIKINKNLNNKSKLNFLLSTSLIFGLSFGYWNITVRPDIISILFEILALFIFLKNKRNPNYLNLFIIGFILFIAWSFKQTALIVFCSINIYLFLNLKIKKNILLVLTWIFLVFLATLIQQNDNFISTLYFLDTKYPFDLFILFYNSAKLLTKNLVLFSGIIIILYLKLIKTNLYLKESKKYVSSDNCLLFIGLFISFIYYLAVHSNAGVSDNHTFILIIFLNFLFIKNEGEILENLNFKKIIIFSIISNIIICIFVISGKLGRLSPNIYSNIEEYKQCIESTSRSKFIDKNYYRLPWISSYSNPSVETFNYRYELENNNLKNGGHEGLIENGFYEYLVLFNDNKYNLEKYSLNKLCKNFKIYKLIYENDR
tara:strand:- start:251 stop:1729 length:1479 start_codon:yes stop_codon:yes gene_type:complete